jgi:aryl-alcohol dehydrogenase-like predicted oxidoreductase
MSNIPRRILGRTGVELSVLGFGGIIVKDETPAMAARVVAEAVERGINYFDVAPAYGNAEERLGPALAPHRDRCFLACKTEKRTAAEARLAIENSLRLMRTDHFDLYQLHAITETADVDTIFAPGGAMEAVLEARQRGLVRWIGFSAHSHRAALRAMENFDFDTVLFPFNHTTWTRHGFGRVVMERALERNMGVLALKAMALRPWPADLEPARRRWPKAWYEPIADPQLAALALRFTLGLPVTSAIPPGHWELFRLALELAESGALTEPLGAEESRTLAAALEPEAPIFGEAACR